MDSNTPEKKPKRPRIGQAFHTSVEGSRYDRPYAPQQRVDNESSDNAEAGENGEGYRPKRTYQSNGYNNQGGYQPRQQRPYNNNVIENHRTNPQRSR